MLSSSDEVSEAGSNDALLVGLRRGSDGVGKEAYYRLDPLPVTASCPLMLIKNTVGESPE